MRPTDERTRLRTNRWTLLLDSLTLPPCLLSRPLPQLLSTGLCHAELAGRLPRAGTGYTYCYVTLGELCAFVVGWGIILEHVLTAAVAAKAWGHYLEYMMNDTMSE